MGRRQLILPLYCLNAVEMAKNKNAAKKAAPKKPQYVEKKIGGAKNGGTRLVRVKRLRNDYPTAAAAPQKNNSRVFAKHARNVRSSLSAGTVASVLAGAHKGKRVIVLKTLESGLLLVNGPFKINGCPLRRVNQRFLLATSTSVD